MSLLSAERIARAALYEGYMLYPYRGSSVKNQTRWAFGALYPEPLASETAERSFTRTEIVLSAHADATLVVRARFLSPVATTPGAGDTDVVERTIALPALSVEALRQAPFLHAFVLAAEQEPATPEVRGEIAVSLEPAAGETTATAPPAGKLVVTLRNCTPLPPEGLPTDRRARRQAMAPFGFASAHVLMHVTGGRFASLTDPPPHLGAAVSACRNEGSWPVLVGEPERADTVLSSPIILYDFPEIAPESPGDLFDGTEIDEILILRILTMTEEEKAEARAMSPAVRALLDRTHALGHDDLARLHGVIRRLSANKQPIYRVGDHVILRPTRRADIFDVALAGKHATVVEVRTDFEGRTHVAVTVDDDPGKDLGALGEVGHRFFFGVDELSRA